VSMMAADGESGDGLDLREHKSTDEAGIPAGTNLFQAIPRFAGLIPRVRRPTEPRITPPNHGR